MRILIRIFMIIVLLFATPVFAAAAWWMTVDRPSSWRNADWSSSGVLNEEAQDEEAAIYIMAARTGGFKGAFSVHSWIVLKNAGQTVFERYDKLGWGRPVRKNAYTADARWYSNKPYIVKSITGDKAEELISKVRVAVDNYPFDKRGDYTIWPGPNSNTFVAHVLRQVPELDTVLPPNAVGRDYLGEQTFYFKEADGSDIHISLRGLLGISFGKDSGIELNFLGQSFGFDFHQPAIKLPAFGRLELS